MANAATTTLRLHALYAIAVAHGLKIWQEAGKKDKRPDGRAAWQPVKAACSDETQEGLCWDGFDRDESELLAMLAGLEKTSADADTRECAHFAAKIVGLPRAAKCTVRRVLQHAFNVGQLLGLLRRGFCPPDFLGAAPELRVVLGSDLKGRYVGKRPFRGSPPVPNVSEVVAAMK